MVVVRDNESLCLTPQNQLFGMNYLDSNTCSFPKIVLEPVAESSAAEDTSCAVGIGCAVYLCGNRSAPHQVQFDRTNRITEMSVVLNAHIEETLPVIRRM